MNQIQKIIEFIKRHIIAVAACLFVFLIGVYVCTNLFSADEAVAFGTLFLALITAITVYTSQQQTEYMRKELEFIRRPRISIHHESEEGQTGYLVLQNAGQVPIEATFRITFTPVPETNSDDPILNDEISYDELPDELKITDVIGDWSHKQEFLEPGQKQKYAIGMFGHVLTFRDSDYELEDFHWIRIDGTLTSKLSEDDNRDFKRLFMYRVENSNAIFSSYSFSAARDRE